MVFSINIQVKKFSAQKEPTWTGTENFVGTKVWRIEKFEVGKILFSLTF